MNRKEMIADILKKDPMAKYFPASYYAKFTDTQIEKFWRKVNGQPVIKEPDQEVKEPEKKETVDLLGFKALNQEEK